MEIDKNKLSWEMGNVFRALRALTNRRATEAGVYMGQHHVLRYIATHPGCSQSEIAAALQQSAAAISLSTRRLQEMGLIEKETSSESLRSNSIRITEKGLENGRKFIQTIEYNNERMFEGFSDEEMEQLRGYLERMKNNLDSAEEMAED